MSTRISEIRMRVEAITEIPANEQCIGHLQIAVQSALKDLCDHVEKLEKVMGTGDWKA